MSYQLLSHFMLKILHLWGFKKYLYKEFLNMPIKLLGWELKVTITWKAGDRTNFIVGLVVCA